MERGKTINFLKIIFQNGGKTFKKQNSSSNTCNFVSFGSPIVKAKLRRESSSKIVWPELAVKYFSHRNAAQVCTFFIHFFFFWINVTRFGVMPRI